MVHRVLITVMRMVTRFGLPFGTRPYMQALSQQAPSIAAVEL
jgi:hypothetical protein